MGDAPAPARGPYKRHTYFLITVAPLYTRCPVCQRIVRLTKRGKVARHTDAILITDSAEIDVRKRPPCSGTGIDINMGGVKHDSGNGGTD